MKKIVLMASFIVALGATAMAQELKTENDPQNTAGCDLSIQYYAFSWPVTEGCDNKPRGGTSKGVETTPDPRVHSGWQKLQQAGLTKKQKDRLAILAMAGPYRVDFNFIETVGFSDNYQRDRPYHSWGTEYVYVVEDKSEFISLQHIMVMYFKTDEGGISEPMVMKHWRQDWTYEDDTLLVFDQNKQWHQQSVAKNEGKGYWSQAVFQVDDSPRYESIGRWQHNPSFSSWISGLTSRPLPRREFSVRDDYQVLSGYNRHTINRFGWVHEQENWKQQVADNGEVIGYVAKEEGIGRYRRIVGTDFGPGADYWQQTQAFWQDVRAEWARLIVGNDPFKLRGKVAGKKVFMPLFAYAAKLNKDKPYDSETGQKFIAETLKKYVIK